MSRINQTELEGPPIKSLPPYFWKKAEAYKAEALMKKWLSPKGKEAGPSLQCAPRPKCTIADQRENLNSQGS